jgi:hypothetical protein
MSRKPETGGVPYTSAVEKRRNLPENRTTLLYVLCSPHSGSTILAIALANHPEIFFAGELLEIPEPGWIPGHDCACGRHSSECPIWGPVQREVCAAVRMEDMAEDQRWFWRWRSVPQLALARWWPTELIEARANRLRELIESIGRWSGRLVVIDSSKMPSRALAYALLESDNFHVKFLHLVRDPGPEIISRIGSDIRHEKENANRPDTQLRYAFRWMVANLAFLALFAGQKDRYLRLRHEDVLQDPGAALRAVGDLIGVDVDDIARRAETGDRFSVGHVLQANRIMLEGEVAFRRDPVGRPGGLSERFHRVLRYASASLTHSRKAR